MGFYGTPESFTQRLVGEPLTKAQRDALETLACNGSTTKAKPAIRALVRKGYVAERKRFEAPSVFTLTETGRAAIAKAGSK